MLPPAGKESDILEAGYVTPPVMLVVLNGAALKVELFLMYPPEVGDIDI
jgi:hypothetical protein